MIENQKLETHLISLSNTLMELLWPLRCVGCDKLGVLLCEHCDDDLPRIDSQYRCKRCGAPYGCIVCTECSGTKGPLPLSYTMSVSPFEFCDTAARLTVIYKDQHEQRLATLCALAILEIMPKDWIQWADLVCYIPADRRAIRKRGFCHMRLVAEEFSRLTGLMLTHVLQKETVRDQRSLNRSERAENLARAFRLADTSAREMTNEKINGIKDTTDISGKNIILLDDVCTTTATLNIAGEVLLAAGAIEVRAATVCRVY